MILSGFYCVSFEIQKDTNTRCAVKRINESLKDEYKETPFKRTIKALSHCKYPSIIPFIGISNKNGFGYIYLAEAQNGTLHSFLENNLKSKQFNPNFNNTSKFVISYGISKAMHYLSYNNILIRNLNSNNVLLDDRFYPFLTNFYADVQLYNTTESKFIAPEVIEGSQGCLPYAGIYS